MKKIFSVCIFVLLHFCVQGQTFKFENNANQIAIYNKISALQLLDANKEIQKAIAADATNLSSIHLANYIDFYELFFNENPAKYATQKAFQSKRIALMDKLPDNNAYKKYAKGVQYFQWALVKLKFKDYLSAAQDLRTSYLLLTENKKAFPNFTQQNIYIGAIETVVGTIPAKYRWLANILGLKGNVKTGMAQVDISMIAKDKQYPMDVLFLYVYMKHYFAGQHDQAWQALQNLVPTCATNRLLTFMVANISLNQTKADITIAAINSNKGKPEFMEIPMLDYELGTAYMFKLDDKCKIHLQQFINKSKGKFYLKDAYYKLCMYSYMHGNTAAAEQYRIKINTIGNTETDADKTAQNFYENKNYSPRELLQARFLCDGGFFKEAQIALLKVNAKMLTTPLLQLEYQYRQGRIFQELGKTQEAVTAYVNAMQLGTNNSAYYSARAALECGHIFDKLNNKPQAILYYNKCIAMDNHDFKSSLDQQAKAGLQRMGQ